MQQDGRGTSHKRVGTNPTRKGGVVVCDTIVALGTATKDGSTLFAKNSDREPDEVQNLEVLPAARHTPGSSVRCTHIAIPQVEETFRVLICRPFQMFGAEMGANDQGVVIGNEALFTREKPKQTGLTGMDLIRLALERGGSAREALDIIINLLEIHGQGGDCGYRKPFFYMNGFLIADAREAYVLETVHSWWAWKKIDDVWSISNVISLENDFDDCSPSLIENALKKGWCRNESDFSFRDAYTDTVLTWGAAARRREDCSRDLLRKGMGSLTSLDFMNMLRHHGGKDRFRPDKDGGTLCMHAADKLIRRSQSVGSLVAKIGERERQYYATGASSPCLRPFFPVFGGGAGLPEEYRSGGADYDDQSWWWFCERSHRRALNRWPDAFEAMRDLRKPCEEKMVADLEGIVTAGPDQSVMDGYFGQARQIVTEWEARLGAMPEGRVGFLYRRYWEGQNRRNGIRFP